MERQYRRCERFPVRIEKGHLLLLFRLLPGRLNSLPPLLLLHPLQLFKALLKYGSFLFCQALQEPIVPDQKIRDHLVHVIGVIPAYIPVAIVRQGHLIIFCPVDDAGLKGRINVPEAHGRRRPAQKPHHFNIGRGLLDPDLKPPQILRPFYRLFYCKCVFLVLVVFYY